MLPEADQGFALKVRLLDTYRRLRRWHLTAPVQWVYSILKRPLESHFISGNAVSVAQLNFYKLGTYIKIKNNNQ